MAATTLVTFLFDCPSAARTVEILGSWDNFSQPYHLKRDQRRGRSNWTGCFSFDNIICDGDFDHPSEKRSGPLLMGGTYWYYYKVNDDEEHHDPSQPSTTFCPLLPGQRLNILEVPMESRNRSNSESSRAFTRNPEDKYLTPVPPKPLPSPRLGDYCRETYKVPMHSSRELRAFTAPTISRSQSPVPHRHGRSASTSRTSPSGASFPDFRGLKEKIVSSKRSPSSTRGRSPQRPFKELEIGAPVLISTTAEEVNLVPLPSLQVPSSTPSLSPPISAKLREFSPLGSNPVDPIKDLGISFPPAPEDTLDVEDVEIKRPQSDVTATVSTSIEVTPSRTRANSSDIRRTRVYVYSNEPWISSPKPRAEEHFERAPVLQKPSLSLQAPDTPADERPISRHGEELGTLPCKSPLDKDLPALPRYLVPAPLFACSASSSPVFPQEEYVDDIQTEQTEGAKESPMFENRSHFSTWSSNSAASDVITDDDAVYSPSLSSMTSNSTQPNSPQHYPDTFANEDHGCVADEYFGMFQHEHVENNAESTPSSPDRKSVGPPMLRLSTLSFGPSLLPPDIHHEPTTPRRQAACFGYSGFQGYSLPEDVTTSQATITKDTMLSEPAIASARSSTVSQLETMMDDFGYLGRSVS